MYEIENDRSTFCQLFIKTKFFFETFYLSIPQSSLEKVFYKVRIQKS